MLNTTLCYITQGDAVLMLHRVKKKNDVNKDKWIGIGGKFESGKHEELLEKGGYYAKIYMSQFAV